MVRPYKILRGDPDVSPSHIVVPAMVPNTAISNKITVITPVLISCLIPSFVRESIATFINSQGLIEIIPANTPRFDHDPVTLAPKGLLVEQEGTNLLPRSNAFSTWTLTRVSVTAPMDFHIFASEGVWLIISDGTSNIKIFRRSIS
jgi:hypothetical protein